MSVCLVFVQRMECLPTVHRGSVGLDRAQMAYRLGHVGPSSRDRSDCALARLLEFYQWRGTFGDRHCNGLSDIAGCYWRRGPSGMARRLGRRLSSLARFRLRLRCAAGRSRRRPPRRASGDLVDRWFNLRLGCGRCGENAGNEAIEIGIRSASLISGSKHTLTFSCQAFDRVVLILAGSREYLKHQDRLTTRREKHRVTEETGEDGE